MKKLPIGIAPRRMYEGTYRSLVELCVKEGYSSIEFKYASQFVKSPQVSQRVVRYLRKVVEEEHLTLSVHAPYNNIADISSAKWQSSLDHQLRALEFAEEIGAKTYTIHPGWVEEGSHTDDRLAQGKKQAIGALSKLDSFANHVAICLENQSVAEPGKIKNAVTVSDLRAIAACVGDSVRFTLDTGHANLDGQDPIDFLRSLDPKAVLVGHLHDNHGSTDSHLPPGEGTIDWHEFLNVYLERSFAFPLFLELSSKQEILEGAASLNQAYAELKELT